MDIYLIWAQDPDGDVTWLVDAWDDDTIAENYSGWREKIVQAEKDYEPQNVRIVKAYIDFDGVRKAFEVPRVEMTVEEV